MNVHEDLVVVVTDDIRTAMERITRNKHRVVVVLDGRKVVGTVSDGDIRRALLHDVLPIAPVETIMNLNCIVTTSREPREQRAIVERELITLLPVVDESRELVDVILAFEPFSESDSA